MIWTIGLILACGERQADTSASDTPDPETTETAPEPQPTSEPESSGEPESNPEPESQPTSEPESSGEPESNPEPESEPESGPSGQGDVAAGEQIVQSTCMGYCHTSNPAIENSGSMTEEELRALFANGQGYMPAQNLTEQEIVDVIAYLWATYGQ